jgi:hypothetical protein
MKVFRIVLLIAALLYSFSRLAFTCARKDENNKAQEFYGATSIIENERLKIFQYDEANKDSIAWMVSHTRSFNRVLDSCINHYRSNYNTDETRYAKYLAVLYEYKKIFYLYDERAKAVTEPLNPSTSKKPKKFRTQQFEMQLRSAFLKLRQVEFQLNYDL